MHVWRTLHSVGQRLIKSDLREFFNGSILVNSDIPLGRYIGLTLDPFYGLSHKGDRVPVLGTYLKILPDPCQDVCLKRLVSCHEKVIHMKTDVSTSFSTR